MTYKVGDRFRVVGGNPYNRDIEGEIGTVTRVYGPRSYAVKFDCRSSDGGWTDEGDMELVTEKTMLQKLSATLKRVLSPNFQKLYKAGFIDGDLELTCAGKEALYGILLKQHEEELAALAQVEIEEAEKENE